ncbi:mitochondrial CIV assembly protein Cox18b (Oxa1Lb) [Andalucia godoyi]|uniref:Mitochondrial CIV assembly protein Cox18a (Oxa1La) n=1 Tax=Andalucia godoyi TaxID=505711 RepID=A0A8K0AID9_ANDGO|nr:mitochondrial CIV assembly protein Cox18a (Oxa1La) [Andalucia godoyi]KAF0852877.1 mitochondrial CIV assembly protein Cox18b (Oxa1Lb) [Andalucia godoyi]|eukprot:ANDGO_02660.mRNA.1 mitochondrial CIV assembly protein Cox18a (Oxa1La)
MTIITFTLAFRLLVFPLNVSLVRNARRLYNIQPQIDHYSRLMRVPEALDGGTASPSAVAAAAPPAPPAPAATAEAEAREGESFEEVAASRVRAASSLMALFKEQKCHPLKNVLSPLLFAPMFLTIFAAVHRLSDPHPSAATAGGVELATQQHPGITTEGMLWFSDLTASDPTFMLPVVSAITWLITIELGLQGVPAWATTSAWRQIVRLIPLFFMPITFPLSSGVFLYWLTSNAVAIARTILLRSAAVRKFFRVPDLAKTLP